MDIAFYADERGREPCLKWMQGLSREKRIALETAIELVLAHRGLDVVETEFGKTLGGGLYEFGDKAKNPGDRRQDKEIAEARKLLTAHREAEKRARAGHHREAGRR